MKFLKKVIGWLLPSKNGFRLLFLMFPVILFGWIVLPIGTITYPIFINTALLIMMWLDIMDIRDKLKIK